MRHDMVKFRVESKLQDEGHMSREKGRLLERRGRRLARQAVRGEEVLTIVNGEIMGRTFVTDDSSMVVRQDGLRGQRRTFGLGSGSRHFSSWSQHGGWAMAASAASALRCTVALRQYGHRANWLEALQLFERMQQKGPRPNATLNVLAKARRWEEAIHVLQDCYTRRMADTRSYNTTLETGGRRRGWAQQVLGCQESIREHQKAENLSLELLAQMQRHRIQQSVVTLGTLVASAASVASWRQKGSQWPRCLVLLQSLTSPSVVSYNACISACSRDQQSRLALQLFHEMSYCRVHPTLVTYNALIHAHARNSHVDKITGFIQQMQDLWGPSEASEPAERSGCPGLSTFGGLLAAFEKRYKWREALHAAFTLPILRDVISFNALISACEKGQQWHLALSLFGRMQQEHLQPNVITYSAAISACEQVQQWSMALLLLHEMRQKFVPPNVVTYGAASSACEKGQRWSEVLDLLQQMGSEGLQPNVISFTASVRACEKAQRWEIALKLCQEMLRITVAPDVISHRSYMSLSQSQQPRKAQALLAQQVARSTETVASKEVTRKLLQPMVEVFHSMPSKMGHLETLGFAWRENVCDLGPHFTRDAAEQILPQGQAEVVSSRPILEKLMQDLQPVEPVAQDQLAYTAWDLHSRRWRSRDRSLLGYAAMRRNMQKKGPNLLGGFKSTATGERYCFGLT
eukprot:s1061_g22.t2